MTPVLLGIGLALFLLVGGGNGTHQERTEAPTLTITAQTVVIDAVVTDRSGKVVPDLKRDDFRAFENGKPQAVDFFEPHIVPSGTRTARSEPLPPNTFSNAMEVVSGSAVNVLLIDSLNTSTGDRIAVRRQLMELMERLPSGVPIAVLELKDRLTVVQGFTSDPAQVRASIEGWLSGASAPLTQHLPDGSPAQSSSVGSLNAMGSDAAGGSQATEAIASLQGFLHHFDETQENVQIFRTLEGLQEVGRYLTPIPARKNLLWVSGSFPLCVPGVGDCPYNDLIEEAIDALAVARVSLYPIDAAIPGVPNADIGGRAAEPGLSTGSVNLENDQWRRITIDAMAEATGGKAYHGNDLGKNVVKAIDDGSRYYTLAYTPTNESEKDGTRKIEVQVVSGHYNVSYRRTYYERSSGPAVKSSKASDPLRSLMMRGMPSFSQVQYRVNVEPAAVSDARIAGENPAAGKPLRRYRIGFFVTPESVNLQTGPDGAEHGNVEVGLIARNENGQALNWMVRDIGLVVRREQLAMARQMGISFHLDLDVPKGTAYLATGVYDTSGNRAGTIEIPMASLREERATTRATALTVPPPGPNAPVLQKLTTERVSVQGLEQLVRQLHDKQDKEAAQRLAGCKLTERLSTVRLEILQRALPGERSSVALLALADVSAYLRLPAADIALEPPPDTATQKAILSRGIDFVAGVTARMPNFLAQENTVRFEDTKFGIYENDPVITTPDVFHQVDSEVASVRFSGGREERAKPSSAQRMENAGAPPMGVTTWGIFGPMLQTVMRDILNGKIGWGYWEQSPTGPIAVFRYAVPKSQATYALRWCCTHAGPGIYRDLQFVPQYHGEIAIQPATGAVTRMVLIADPQPDQPVSTADAFVEYGPVEIGGQTYTCPTRSATLLVATSPIEHGTYAMGGETMYHATDEKLRVTSISDTSFAGYHVFRSDMKILEH